MEEKKHWYVIHTYSGYENKVTANLERKVHSLGMEDEIFQILVPMQNEVEVKGDEKKVATRKTFPGYVLIEMIVNDRSWYAVRNTPGVTGFVGEGTKPIPLSDAEVERILGNDAATKAGVAVHPKIDFKLQQLVRLTGTGFAGKVGTVAEINDGSGKLKVLVDVFGRETPVEVDYSQVEEV